MKAPIQPLLIKLKKLLPFLALSGAAFLWGSSFSSMNIVLKTLTPYEVMCFRSLVAFFCIIPFFKQLIPKNYKKSDWKIILPTVLFQPCLYFLFESYALQLTTSSQAGVISACLPLMVAVTAWFFLAESIGIKTIFGLILSITGVVMLTLFQSSHGTAPNPVLGNFLEFIAMVCATFYIILIKQLSSRYNTWTLTAMQVTAGALFFLPGLSGIIQADPEIWTCGIIMLLVFLGAFVSLGAFGLYNYGISKVPASKASIFINLIPVIAVLLGWMVLDEVLNAKQLFAAVIVIAGVFLSNNR